MQAMASAYERAGAARYRELANIMGIERTKDVPIGGRGWHLQSCNAFDVDEHAAHLTNWRQQYDQLSAGGFEGQLDELHAGDAQVYRERTSQALRQRCEVWGEAVWCGITAVQGDGSRINGRLVGGDGVMVCGRAAGFELVSPAGHDILGVVLTRSALHDHARALGARISWPLLDQAPWLAVRPEQRQLALARLQNILATAVSAGAAPQSLTVQKSLRLTMLDVVIDLLEAPAIPAESRCNATTRRRLVARVHDWLQAEPERAPSVPELCQRLNVSRRTLQYAFEAEVAMCPKAYLRSVRLNGVRRALRAGHIGHCTVQIVAAQWGFWNLSQFACDYRQQFGERPSDTLARR
jgi:AraC family transcriptional regulator, ethanolamine operon transcriptional activator